MRVRFGEFTFDGQLTRNSRVVALTPKAAALLGTLIAAAPDPVSKDDLYQRLWAGVIVEPGNLHNLISEIRSALGDDDHAIIGTVHRVGYAFAAPLTATAPRLEIGDNAVALREGENEIGRELLGTPDASRHHARIDVDGQRVSIEDLRSKNGTFVNGEKIRGRTALRDGDQIVFGRTRATLRLLDVTAPTITA
jgi:DNA-binding winged helix-turn-helix (wHTH) protein